MNQARSQRGRVPFPVHAKNFISAKSRRWIAEAQTDAPYGRVLDARVATRVAAQHVALFVIPHEPGIVTAQFGLRYRW